MPASGWWKARLTAAFTRMWESGSLIKPLIISLESSCILVFSLHSLNETVRSQSSNFNATFPNLQILQIHTKKNERFGSDDFKKRQKTGVKISGPKKFQALLSESPNHTALGIHLFTADTPCQRDGSDTTWLGHQDLVKTRLATSQQRGKRVQMDLVQPVFFRRFCGKKWIFTG